MTTEPHKELLALKELVIQDTSTQRIETIQPISKEAIRTIQSSLQSDFDERMKKRHQEFVDTIALSIYKSVVAHIIRVENRNLRCYHSYLSSWNPDYKDNQDLRTRIREKVQELFPGCTVEYKEYSVDEFMKKDYEYLEVSWDT